MIKFHFLAALLGICSAGSAAHGGWPLFDGCHWQSPNLREEWCHRCGWCPDDYCPRALPIVPCNRCSNVDDFCPKALPGVKPNACGCVDDYCPKKCPIWLGCLWAPWYKCAPGASGIIDKHGK
jgi:hypothetical protein